LKDRLVRPIVSFAANEATGGLILVVLAVMALFWANVAPAGAYDAFWNTKVKFSAGELSGGITLRHFVNDALMALFFLLMGLEIKREFMLGELSERRKAALPVAAAIGGMLVPALIYALCNLNGGDLRGTGVPMATDIAFSLGVLALLGSRVPAGLKILLAAIAIVDDLGAVLVIAIFYTSSVQGGMLVGMLACLAVLFGLNKLGVRHPLAYFAVGIPLWAFTYASGVHATVAGVLLALTIPVRTRIDPVAFRAQVQEALDAFDECRSGDPYAITEARHVAIREIELYCEQVEMPLERVEDLLAPWITFLVVPMFALANAGVRLGGSVDVFGSPIAIGIFLGLVLGKPLGVLLAAQIALRSRTGVLPEGVTMRQFAGVAVLTGIGFTMSLFVAELAFGESPSLAIAKLTTLAASVFMGALGYFLLWSSRTRSA
jgi:NhaA family Na+:H+ antiporter